MTKNTWINTKANKQKKKLDESSKLKLFILVHTFVVSKTFFYKHLNFSMQDSLVIFTKIQIDIFLVTLFLTSLTQKEYIALEAIFQIYIFRFIRLKNSPHTYVHTYIKTHTHTHTHTHTYTHTHLCQIKKYDRMKKVNLNVTVRKYFVNIFKF